jgi:hypothetical protein
MELKEIRYEAVGWLAFSSEQLIISSPAQSLSIKSEEPSDPFMVSCGCENWCLCMQ